MTAWPDWWEWELELCDHVLERMVDRGFNETDLRLMFDSATGYHEDVVDGRWVIETRHAGRPWEIIVEPIPESLLLTVVTAYPAD
jgi:hypothetical protein